MWGPLGSTPEPKAKALASAQVALDLLRQAFDARDKCADPLEQLELCLLTLIELLKGVPVYTPVLCAPLVSAPTVRLLRIQRKPDGSGLIWIDSKPPFPLSAGLTDLLEYLASGDGGADSELVGWKSRSAVLERLQKQRGKQLRPAYVNNLVNVLRDRLEAVGLSRDFVQTHDAKGVRFALRRPVTASPHVVGGGSGDRQ